MKASTLTKRLISVLSLLLAVVMLFSACGGAEDTSSDPDTSDVGDNNDVDNNDADNNDDNDGDNDNDNDTTDKNSSKTNTTNKNSSKTNTTNKNSSKTNTTNKNSSKTSSVSNNTATGSTTWSSDYLSTISSSVKKKGIHILMWRKYRKTEQAMIDAFSKKTGIKVRTTVTTENEYATKLLSLISGNDAPDVVLLESNKFPGLVTKAMQSLDAETFRLDDSIWKKDYMDCFKANGKYFSVAINGGWSCEDCNYVTLYNPTLLKQCGVTTMPYDLYKAGKWNWDAQEKIANQVYTKGSGNYVGLALQTYDLYMLSAGTDFVSYNGKEFSNTLNNVSGNSLLVESWKRVAQLNKNKALSEYNMTGFAQSKVGLFTTIAYATYNEGGSLDAVAIGSANVQAVPVAGPAGKTTYNPVRPKTWGVAKRAKNAEGAAYFLRYWLDPSNCNMSSTFYNKQLETVYNTVVSSKTKSQPMYGSGILNFVSSSAYLSLVRTLAAADPAAITSELNAQKGVITSAITSANKEIKRNVK